MKQKQLYLWIFAIFFTFSIAYFQRKTGPTVPVTGKISIENSDVKYYLLRTETTGKDAEVNIFTGNNDISGSLRYKRYKSHDEWSEKEMTYKDGYLTNLIPSQPPAGKVMYEVVLKKNKKSYFLTQEPVIIRFKGDVPNIFLIPHIFFMFIGLLMSVRIGLQSIFINTPSIVNISITFIFLVLGGLIFGPIVQKYAFGAYWTGFPFGHDFTDNKTAFAILFWAIALIMSLFRNKNTRWWILAAAIVLLSTYLIPHSLFGSELDQSSLEQKL